MTDIYELSNSQERLIRQFRAFHLPEKLNIVNYYKKGVRGMLITSVRYLCNRNGRRKTDVTCVVFENRDTILTDEVLLKKLREMGIDAIKILNSKPKAEVLGVSYDETTRQ